MLAHREMEKPDFSFAQVCSNDYVFLKCLASPFIEEERNTLNAVEATINTLL